MSKKYTFGIRVKDKKRYSPFSVLMSLEPVVLPLPPTGVKAVVFPDRIEITWSPPEENRDQSSPANVEGYNIFLADRFAQDGCPDYACRRTGFNAVNRSNSATLKGDGTAVGLHDMTYLVHPHLREFLFQIIQVNSRYG